MAQQGQVFKLKGNGKNGDAAWAYRYRLDGRASKRPQMGGFATRAEAPLALRRRLARLRPGGRRRPSRWRSSSMSTWRRTRRHRRRS